MIRYGSAARWFPVLVLFTCAAALGGDQPNKEELLTRIVVKSLGSWHYSPPRLDDAYAKRVFTLHVKRIDPQRRFLLQEDIDSLKKLESGIDEEIKEGSTRFFDYTAILMRNRIREAQSLAQSILEAPIDLDADDSLPADPEKQPYARNRDELKQRWARLIKYQVLTQIQDVRESREKEVKEVAPEAAKGEAKGGRKDEGDKSPKAAKAKAKAAPSAPTAAEEEKAARSYVARSTRRVFERMLKEDRLARRR